VGSRIIIFGLPSAADYIHRVKHIYIDGTFAITPVFRRAGGRNSTRRLPDTLEEALADEEDGERDEQQQRRVKFSQLYVVLAERNESDRVFVTPILHALLPNKQTATYDKLWRMIRTIYPTLNPTSFSSDFELSAIHAVVNSYHSSVAVLGCGFHYAHALTKQANKKKVEKLFREKTCLYVKVSRVSREADLPITYLYSEETPLRAGVRPDRESGGVCPHRGATHHRARTPPVQADLLQDLGSIF